MFNRINLLAWLMLFGILSQAIHSDVPKASSAQQAGYRQFFIENKTDKAFKVAVTFNNGRPELESLVAENFTMELPDPTTFSTLSIKLVGGLSPHLWHKVPGVAMEEILKGWGENKKVTLRVWRDTADPFGLIQKGFKYTITEQSQDL